LEYRSKLEERSAGKTLSWNKVQQEQSSAELKKRSAKWNAQLEVRSAGKTLSSKVAQLEQISAELK